MVELRTTYGSCGQAGSVFRICGASGSGKMSFSRACGVDEKDLDVGCWKRLWEALSRRPGVQDVKPLYCVQLATAFDSCATVCLLAATLGPFVMYMGIVSDKTCKCCDIV